jgi:CyaY protein
MDEQRYLRLADETFKHIRDAFEEVDPDLAEVELAGDVLTITFADKLRCIANTQRPTRQIWLAHGVQAWHFAYDEAAARWLDDKHRGHELYSTIAAIVRETARIDLHI